MLGLRDEVIARVENFLICKVAFEKALFVYPDAHLEMRQGAPDHFEVERGTALLSCPAGNFGSSGLFCQWEIARS